MSIQDIDKSASLYNRKRDHINHVVSLIRYFMNSLLYDRTLTRLSANESKCIQDLYNLGMMIDYHVTNLIT